MVSFWGCVYFSYAKVVLTVHTFLHLHWLLISCWTGRFGKYPKVEVTASVFFFLSLKAQSKHIPIRELTMGGFRIKRVLLFFCVCVQCGLPLNYLRGFSHSFLLFFSFIFRGLFNKSLYRTIYLHWRRIVYLFITYPTVSFTNFLISLTISTILMAMKINILRYYWVIDF